MSDLQKSDISVVICNYNYQQYIRETIESVLAQTIEPADIIVVDDGSTDDSRDVISKYHSHARLIFKTNEGQCSCYNAGVAVATGKYILYLDSDDRLLPNALQEVQKHLRDDVTKLQYRMRVINQDGKVSGSAIPRISKPFDALQLIRKGLEYPSPPASGNVYRTDFLKEVFPLPVDKTDKVGADYFLIFAAPYFGKVICIDQVLAEYRVHGFSKTIELGNSIATENNRPIREANRKKWLQLHVKESIPSQLISFTVLKGRFAAVCCEEPLRQRVVTLYHKGFTILRTIWITPQYTVFEKLLLSLWVLVLPFLPKKVRAYAARKVCNPAFR